MPRLFKLGVSFLFFVEFDSIVVWLLLETQSLISDPRLPENVPLVSYNGQFWWSVGGSLHFYSSLWSQFGFSFPLSILKVGCSPHLCTSPLFHPGTGHITCRLTLSATLKVADGMLQPEYLHTWLSPVYLKCRCQDKHSPAASNVERKGFELLSAIYLICAFNGEELAFFDLQPFFPWKLPLACNNLGGPLSDC